MQNNNSNGSKKYNYDDKNPFENSSQQTINRDDKNHKETQTSEEQQVALTLYICQR